MFSSNLDILDGESVDVLQTDMKPSGYADNLSDPQDSVRQQSRSQYYDSGDSDDYAESDN